MKPPRGYEALRARRVSIPGASYFVTICTRGRQVGLARAAAAAAITNELSEMKTEKAFLPRAWVIMPEHVHLLFRLSDQLNLGQVSGRLKARTRSALATQNLEWQGNYYEHRLRPDDPIEDVLRYLYMN